MLERNFQEAKGMSDNEVRKYVTTTATLAVYEQVVRCTCAASYTLTLPPVAAAKGKTYCIMLTAAPGGGQAITIADAADSLNWSNLTLNAQYEGTVLYSDGEIWWELQARYS